MNAAPPQIANSAPSVIDVSSAQSVRKVDHVTIEYTIKFEFSFDVEHPVTRQEYIELSQNALVDFRNQMPPHVKAYPELILRELVKRKLIDVESFKPVGNGNHASPH